MVPDLRPVVPRYLYTQATRTSGLYSPMASCLGLLTGGVGDSALDAARNLSSHISIIKDERALQGLLLLSICIILDHSGRISPGALDGIVGKLTKSTKPKYSDALKRGARVANEIIVQWAERQPNREPGDLMRHLEQATQQVISGKSKTIVLTHTPFVDSILTLSYSWSICIPVGYSKWAL